MRVASVDDDVAFFEMGDKLFNYLIDSLARLDHHHDATRTLQCANEFLDGVSADDLRSRSFVLNKIVDLGDGAVEDRDLVAVVVHIEDQVLPHDGEADESDVTTFRLHSL